MELRAVPLLLFLSIAVCQSWASKKGWTNAGSPELLSPDFEDSYTSFSVFGSRFTLWNYYTWQGSYLALCGMGETTCNLWYSALTNKEDKYTAYGPGPNTTMYYGWEDVKANLESWAPMLKDGTMQRYNELGVQVFNTVMWPETKTIALGYTTEWHGFVRPYLGNSGDKGRKDGESCDGSTCWNLEYLKSVFRAQFAEMDSFTAGDEGWMLSVILHKLFANLDITEEEAKDFVSFQLASLSPGILPQKAVASLGLASSLVDQREAFLKKIKPSIEEKYADDGLNATQVTVLTNAILDTLLYAGGLSVPTAIQYMMGLYYTRLPFFVPKPVSDGEVDLEDTEGLYNWMFEVLRRYPPVAGVPRWITTNHGKTWKHQIANVAKALNDERIFPDPKEFKLGREGLNYNDDKYSIGWADFALEDGDTSSPNSHVCPGKDFSKVVIQAFFEEYFAAGPWSPALPFLIYYNPYKVMPPFTVCKNSSFGFCTMLRIGLVCLLVFCCGCCCCCRACCKKMRKKRRAKVTASREVQVLPTSAPDTDYMRLAADPVETTEGGVEGPKKRETCECRVS